MATDPAQILRERDAEVARIRGYVDLTEEAKDRRIAEVNAQAREAYEEAVETREREIAKRVEKAEKAVFAIPVPYGSTKVEEAQIRAAHRAAYESVYHAVAPAFDSVTAEGMAFAREELDRLLTRTERTGDKELSRAVYHLATEKGERGVADSYLASRPDERQRWEEYGAARTEAEEARSFEGLLGRTLEARMVQAPAGHPAQGSDFGSAFAQHLAGGGA